jgi:arabinose-5-phosphate isomerase
VKDENQAAGASSNVLNAARSALEGLISGWDPTPVESWCAMVLGRKGRVVLTGMGKSGLIAQKVAATLASTGCPSLYLHPAEALHGDLGMVTEADSILALSNSGETEEVVRLLPSLIRLGIPLAAITGREDSSLAKAAQWTFLYGLPKGEGCPLDLAPMASTTIQLIWGDVLAATLMDHKGFTRNQFAMNHPAGSLGAKLLTVKALMHKTWPRVQPGDPLMAVLGTMTTGRLGMTSVMEGENLLGVITDGDLRRGLEIAEKKGLNPLELSARDLMSGHPACIPEDALAVEAAGKMESRKITFLMVEHEGRPTGVLHLHQLLEAKVL